MVTSISTSPPVGLGDLDLDAGDLGHDDLMGEAQVHHQVGALLGGTVTHAVDLQFLGEVLVHPFHHVGE